MSGRPSADDARALISLMCCGTAFGMTFCGNTLLWVMSVCHSYIPEKRRIKNWETIVWKRFFGRLWMHWERKYAILFFQVSEEMKDQGHTKEHWLGCLRELDFTFIYKPLLLLVFIHSSLFSGHPCHAPISCPNKIV